MVAVVGKHGAEAVSERGFLMTEVGRRFTILTQMTEELRDMIRKEPMTGEEYRNIMEGVGVSGLTTYAVAARKPELPSPPDMSVRQQRRWAQRKGHRE
jgi:hypothetical protein